MIYAVSFQLVAGVLSVWGGGGGAPNNSLFCQFRMILTVYPTSNYWDSWTRPSCYICTRTQPLQTWIIWGSMMKKWQYLGVGQKINTKCIFVSTFSSICFSTQSPPNVRHLLYRWTTGLPTSSWYFVSCIIIHHVTTVCSTRSSVNCDKQILFLRGKLTLAVNGASKGSLVTILHCNLFCDRPSCLFSFFWVKETSIRNKLSTARHVAFCSEA